MAARESDPAVVDQKIAEGSIAATTSDERLVSASGVDEGVIQDEVCRALVHVLPDGLESTTVEMVPFANAAELLLLHGLDLMSELRGVYDIYQNTGVIDRIEEKLYPGNKGGKKFTQNNFLELFKDFQFTQSGLLQLVERLKKGEKWTPVFDPGIVDFFDLWNNIRVSQLGHSVGLKLTDLDGGDELKHHGDLKEIDPKTIEHQLRILPFMPPEVKEAEGGKIFLKAGTFSQGTGPKIVFTPDEMEPSPNVERLSATDYALQMLAGKKYIDPVSNLLLLLVKRDRITKEANGTPNYKLPYPGTKDTLYPGYIFPNGHVPASYTFLHGHQNIHLVSYPAGYGSENFAAREILC